MIVRDFFYASVALALTGLIMVIIGLLRMKREKVEMRKTKTRNQLVPTVRSGESDYSQSQGGKIWARSRGVSVSVHEEYAVRDLIAGLKVRDTRAVGFTLRAGGTFLLGLSTFLAVGTGIETFSSSPDGSGWCLVGFAIIFAGFVGFQLYKGRNNP